LGGVKQTTEFIDKLTWGLAATIVVSSILITMQSAPKKEKKAAPAQTKEQKK